MEGGLGSTRMGSRSSTRHGPASVFQGRVRRWHKSWAPVLSSQSQSAAASRVVLYKWTPITLPTTNCTKESTPEDPAPTKTLRFMPVEISVLDSDVTISEAIMGNGMQVAVVLQDREEEAQKGAEGTGTLEQEVQVGYALTGEPEASLPQDATGPAGGADDVGNGSVEGALDIIKPGNGCGEGDKVQGSREALAELQESHAAQVPEPIAMVQF